MSIIGVVGFIGSGKGTVGKILEKNHGYHIDSFAAPLKDALCDIFGWDRALMEGNTPEGRHFREVPDLFWSSRLNIPKFTPRLAMQLLGTNLLRQQFHTDIWVSSMEYRITNNLQQTPRIVIADTRFRNEIHMIHRLGGHVIRVDRGPEPEWYNVAYNANAGDQESAFVMREQHGDVHVSEWDWIGSDFDWVINNHGDIQELEQQVDHMMEQL